MDFPDFSKPGNESNYPDLSMLSEKKYPAVENIKNQISSANGPQYSDEQMNKSPLINSYLQKINDANAQPKKDDTDISKLAASAAMTLGAPEVTGGEGLFTRYLLDPALNAFSRVGAGTAGNIAYETRNTNGMQHLPEIAKNSLINNMKLEVPASIARTPGYAAEMFNPTEYAAQKGNQIKNEFENAQAIQKGAYNSVFNKYGDSLVTLTPNRYLGFTNRQIARFTPEIKQSYKDFQNSPTLQNLHNLQSQMGKDYRKISDNTNLINKSQTIKKTRDMVKNKIQSSLSFDKDALNNYNHGSDLTRDLVEPYRSNDILKDMVNGVKKEYQPTDTANAIRKGIQTGDIPAGHALVNHLHDLDKMTNFGNLAQDVIPPAIGAIAGNKLYSGGGGMLAGALSGAGLNHYFSDKLIRIAKNPLVNGVMSKYVKPTYYGAGRFGIGYSDQKK